MPTVFVDQFKTALSHSWVEESVHLIENWSTRRRARYFQPPPARSHGTFWVGDTAAAGKSRHPICSANSLKDDSNSPPKPSVRHQPRRNPAENCQGILVCDRKDNLAVTGHVQHVQKQTVLPSDVCKHEEIKRHTLSKTLSNVREKRPSARRSTSEPPNQESQNRSG